ESVGQAAPVLANLRNLAVAEIRAATDGLTGLPNKRAVTDATLYVAKRQGRNRVELASADAGCDPPGHVPRPRPPSTAPLETTSATNSTEPP
ncbi:MAG: hypothetical protein ABSB59_43355, partial [Streptosporangiaceae bacterium]